MKTMSKSQVERMKEKDRTGEPVEFITEGMLCLLHHSAPVHAPQATISAFTELENYFKHPVIP